MKQWIVAKPDREKANVLARKLELPPFIAMLLLTRGLETEPEISGYLSDMPEIASPFEMKDMDKAVRRITQAVEGFEKICVYGDYDADGVTSTALMYSYLEAVGANVIYYIPSREEEGYGLHAEAVRRLKEQGVSLILTVDNGIAAAEEIAFADSLGIDTVVTDHHTPGETLPSACAVVDPHRADCPSTFKMLSGVGVAFKVILALEGAYADVDSLLENYADLVCIGTIGDIVPLSGENRVFVKRGLRLLNQSDRVGICALLKEAGLEGKPVNAGNVSFGLVPRINACGRLGLSQSSVSLFLTEDELHAQEIAQKLDADNADRKKIEKDILEKINIEIEKNPSLVMDKVIVLDGEGWHQGVIGIVASRIKERYGKPALVITRDQTEAKGSGRSIAGFSLCDAVFACKELLTHCGGHPMAVGIGLNNGNIPLFREKINRYAAALSMPYDILNIDCKLNPAFLDISLAESLRCLEPFGAGNPKPVFGLYNMTLEELVPLKNNKYLKLVLSREKSRVQVMNFSISPEQFPYIPGDKVDLAVTLDINEFKGFQNLSVLLKDIRFSQCQNEDMIKSQRIFENFCKGLKLSPEELSSICPDRMDFALLYRYIRDHKGFAYPVEILCGRLGYKLSLGKIKVMLEAMNELGLIEIYEGIHKTEIRYIHIEEKVDLESARIMKQIKEVL